MFARSAIGLATCFVFSSVVVAQTPMTVTAEATEVIRLKPNQAKITLGIETKDGDSNAAVEANATLRKALTAAVNKLEFKNVATNMLQQKLTKDRDNSGRLGRLGGGGIMPPVAIDSYTVVQPIVFSITESDPVKLIEMVEKITQVAATQGITGEKATSDFGGGFGPYSDTKNQARVVYTVKEGWDAALAPALKKATARALVNATALAEGAKLKVGDVISIEDLTDVASTGVDSNMGIGIRVQADDELQDGELVRKVRVRVKVAAVK